MAYNSASRRVVLFGGSGSPPHLGDTWDWDGVTWSQVSIATPPPPRAYPAMAYDDARQRVVLFGGYTSERFSDTWLYGALTPATTQLLGNACPGTSGPPSITSTPSFLGNQGFGLDLLSARPLAPCLFGISTTAQSLPLGGGCTLYLADPIAVLTGVTNESGFGTVRVPIPLEPAFRGVVVHAQALVFDPAGFAGLAFTAGLRLVLGD